MFHYRYESAFPTDKGKEQTQTILHPHDSSKNPTYFCNRLYTFIRGDATQCYVQTLGHEMSWPDKVLSNFIIDRYTFYYAIKGKAIFDGHPVKAGEFFFSYPYQSFDFYQDKDDPMEYYYIAISGKNAKKLVEDIGFDRVSLISEFDFSDEIKSLFYDALYVPHPNVDLEIYLYSMFLRIMSYHKPKNHGLTGDRLEDSSSYQYYMAAMSFITYNRFNENITVSDVAKTLHISMSYLRFIFNKHSTMSCREMIIRRRIEYASNKILYANSTIKDAALSVGYEDARMFSRVFKRYMGMTPKEFKDRKQHFIQLQEEK